MFLFGILILILIIGVICCLIGVYVTGLCKLFKKAGKEGWEAIIPFYNTWILAEIAGVAWWYALIVILAGVGGFSSENFSWIIVLASYVANFFINYNLSMKFHKDIGNAILMTLFPIIMIPLMGFSKDFEYDKDVVVSENGPIDRKKFNNDSYSSNLNDKDNSYTAKNDSYDDKQYCSYCGKSIGSNSNFCGYCGNEVKK